MRSSLILASLLAPLALAKPVQKRDLTTEVDIVTVWTTVTRGASPNTVSTSSRVAVPTSKPEEGYPYGGKDRASAKGTVAPSEAPVPPAGPAPEDAIPSSSKSVAAPAPTPSAPSPAPASGSGGSYAEKVLYQHNLHRANHTDTSPLAWSDKLTATALKLANTCRFGHNTYDHPTPTPGSHFQMMITNVCPVPLTRNSMMVDMDKISAPDILLIESLA